VTATLRRVAPVVIGLLIAGCGATVAPSPTAVRSPSVAGPSLTPVPGGTSSPAPTVPTTTDTDWGRIWDAVPGSFPRLSTSTVNVPEPVSAEFVGLVGDPKTASATIGRELAAQGWAVDIGSPLEDGTVVLDATGRTAGCKTQIRFTRLGGSVIMSVLYGAACPFS
jgi:hypothetical protein